LNHEWLSIPHGSEHYTFTNMRKNNYEEALFKVEDERFEFDININIYKRTLNFLSQVINHESDDFAVLKPIF
jgi:paired amphipathic helix protein Sin3a